MKTLPEKKIVVKLTVKAHGLPKDHQGIKLISYVIGDKPNPLMLWQLLYNTCLLIIEFYAEIMQSKKEDIVNQVGYAIQQLTKFNNE